MLNKDLFVLDPTENNLINDGVVEINTAHDENGLKVIRHELKTFVCEGEYQRGFYRILDTYLKNLDQPKQPAVWVSGFFGSGKTHLIKMLGYVWDDFKFEDGETARTIKKLPQDVHDLFVELDRKQKAFGKLSVIGTLKDFPSPDIRYSFFQLFLNALGLPPQFHLFKFIYWLKQENLYDELKELIESSGKNFQKEYSNLFVSTAIAKGILQLRPSFAENEMKVKEYFKLNFKRIDSISRDQFISTLRDEVMPLYFGDKIPCTIVVLDEVQQFIGTDNNRTIDIQNLAQDVCSNFNGKMLLIGTGQNALSETPYLQPLQDRFSVKVSLSDTDVETVTRKTVLEKKASAITPLNKLAEESLGEISRNLTGTAFGYLTSDRNTIVSDYPILPSTRKFWKKLLQIIDKAGTSGLLRSQLRIIDESIKAVAEKKLGNIIPADFIFLQKQPQLLSNAILLNETNNLIEEKKSKGGDSILEGRILSIVFLISLFPVDLPGGKIKSDEQTISDLLLDDITNASDIFRTKVKSTIKKLVDEKLLMTVDDEFKLQTRAGQEWEQEFTSHAVKLGNSGDDQIVRFRKDKIVNFFKDRTKALNILHGISKLKRDFEVYSGSDRPGTESKLNLWIRDGWLENESLVMNEIRSEGLATPLAYAFVKKGYDTELKKEIIKYLAADFTLQSKGIPSTPEGEQAKKSMETRKINSLNAISELIEKICSEASIILAGGTKIEKGNLKENIEEALNNISDRQFPEFKTKADYKDWDKAVTQAISGNPEALKKIGWNKEPKDHPVAVDILRFIGNDSKYGKDIRSQFEKSPYGWSRDAIDAIIIVLKNSELISTTETNLNQSRLGQAEFKKEIHTLSVSEKIKLRKLYQDLNIPCKPQEEFIKSNTLLNNFKLLASAISGEAPKPESYNLKFVNEIENLDGNERLLRILNEQEDLLSKYKDWVEKGALVNLREPEWNKLERLINFSPQNDEFEKYRVEFQTIKDERLFFSEPDLIHPLLEKVTELLKIELNKLKQEYLNVYEKEINILMGNEYYKNLPQPEKHAILVRHQLTNKPIIEALDADKLLNEMQNLSLDGFKTRISALPQQFASASEEATRIALPKAQSFSLPKPTLKSEGELDEYLNDLRKNIIQIIQKHGIVILK